MKNTAIIYSSLTGNTEKVAKSIFEVIPNDKILLKAENIEEISLDDYENIIFGFWVDKGSANKQIANLIKKLENKNLYFFGTLGADPESEHGKKVFSKVSKLCSEKNNFLGGILFLGKVSDNLVEKMKKFPLNLIHPLTPERMARIEKASTHPDENDLKNAQEFFKKLFGGSCGE